MITYKVERSTAAAYWVVNQYDGQERLNEIFASCKLV